MVTVLAFLLLLSSAGRGQALDPPTAAPAPPDPIRLEVVSAAEDGPGRVLLRWSREEGDEEDGPRELPRELVLAGGEAQVAVPVLPGESWRVHAEAPGFWSVPVRLGAEDPKPVHRITLWPAGRLGMELEVPEGTDPPEELKVRLAPVPGAEDADLVQPSGIPEVRCPSDEGTIRGCALPAGRWNLRLSAPPFAPHLLWNVQLAAGQKLDLGRLELELGGSIYGRITTETGHLDPQRVRIALGPLVDETPGDDAERERLQQLVMLGTVRPDGSFQFLGVAEGDYFLHASHPGFVGDRRAPVRVLRGEWTEVGQPLYLELPLRLSVQVEPGTDPFRKPWTLHLYRVAEASKLRPVAEGETDASGHWQSPPAPAGDYRLEVRDAGGNSVVWQDVELGRDSTHLRLRIPLVYVEGEVVLGDEPLQADLRFDTPDDYERIEAKSSESGEFFVVLPREGTWLVDVLADSPPVRSRSLEVEVEALEGLDVAEVRIEVPETSVMGRVLDERGRPPTGAAMVHLFRQDGARGPSGTRTDSRGEFAVYGVEPGTYQVSAETDQASAPPVRVDVAEGVEASVTLVLRRETEVTGRVVSPDGGPVPGAKIGAHPLTGMPGGPVGWTVPMGRSSADGRFRISIPAAAQAVRLQVEAPGHALSIHRSSTLEDVEVVLQRSMGTVHLEHVEDLLVVGEDGRVGVLLVDGQPLALSGLLDLAQDARGNAGGGENRLSVRRMPPGSYALCAMSLEEAILVLNEAALASESACVSGFLNIGGELTLRAP